MRFILAALLSLGWTQYSAADEDEERLSFEEVEQLGTNRNRNIVYIVHDHETGCEYLMVRAANGGVALESMKDTCDSEQANNPASPGSADEANALVENE